MFFCIFKPFHCQLDFDDSPDHSVSQTPVVPCESSDQKIPATIFNPSSIVNPFLYFLTTLQFCESFLIIFLDIISWSAKYILLVRHYCYKFILPTVLDFLHSVIDFLLSFLLVYCWCSCSSTLIFSHIWCSYILLVLYYWVVSSFFIVCKLTYHIWPVLGWVISRLAIFYYFVVSYQFLV